MNSIIESKIPQLVELCKKYHVEKLYAFGSVLTNRFGPDSDVDLIVAFDDGAVEDMFDTFFDLKYSLEALFNRPVDLMAEKPIENPYLKQSIESTKQLIYGRAS